MENFCERFQNELMHLDTVIWTRRFSKKDDKIIIHITFEKYGSKQYKIIMSREQYYLNDNTPIPAYGMDYSEIQESDSIPQEVKEKLEQDIKSAFGRSLGYDDC